MKVGKKVPWGSDEGNHSKRTGKKLTNKAKKGKFSFRKGCD